MASIPPGPPPPPAAVDRNQAVGLPADEQSLISLPPTVPSDVAIQKAQALLEELAGVLERLNDVLQQIDPSLVTHIAFMANAGKQIHLGLQRNQESAAGRIAPGPVPQPAEGQPGV